MQDHPEMVEQSTKIGYYHPVEAEDKQVKFEETKESASGLNKGAQPTMTVRKLLNKNNFLHQISPSVELTWKKN